MCNVKKWLFIYLLTIDLTESNPIPIRERN